MIDGTEGTGRGEAASVIDLPFKLSILLFDQVDSDRSLVMIEGAVTIGVV